MSKEDAQKRGIELFSSGYNCAQATLAALAPQFGMEEGAALKLSAAFGGGIARTGGLCGALSGALMALGLKRTPVEISPAIKNAAYARAKQLMDDFAAACGAVHCRDLTGCDLASAEGQARFAREGMHKSVCEKLVRTAISLVEEA